MDTPVNSTTVKKKIADRKVTSAFFFLALTRDEL